MNGYLQRLVAGAARPGRMLHPLVGGLFVKNQRQGVVEESAAVSPQNEPQQLHPDFEARREASEVQEPERLIVQTLQQPLVDRGSREKTEAEIRSPGREDRGERVSSEQEFVAHEPVDAKLESIQALRVHQLLMPEEVNRDPEARAEGPLHEADEHGGRAEVSRAAWMPTERVAAERVARQDSHRPSEDIQIHIGRIEVIAVPPPAQQSVPAVTRKSEGLEEYLSRRDRRAR